MKKSNLKLSDGRNFAYTVSGESQKPAVLFVHGTPLSSMMWHQIKGFDDEAFYRICIDRPGYGDSDYNPRGSVQHIHEDIKELLHHLNLEKVILIGVSGGGPYLAKCALEIPEYLESVHMVSCVGPSVKEAIGNMNVNRYLYKMAKVLPGVVRFQNHMITGMILKDPLKFLELGKKKMTGTDYAILDDPVFAKELAQVYPDGLKNVTSRKRNPMSDDVIFTANWDISLEQIQAEVHVYWGSEDFSIGDQCKYMSDQIPNASKHYYEGDGHFLIYKILPDILDSLK